MKLKPESWQNKKTFANLEDKGIENIDFTRTVLSSYANEM